MDFELEAADKYFNESVFDNEAWVNAEEATKLRAMKNAETILSRHYPRRTIPFEAIYEQAIWVMKISEARKQSQQGVASYSIDGISVKLSQVDRSISQNVFQIMGRRVGTSESGRQGYIHSSEPHVQRRMGREVL